MVEIRVTRRWPYRDEGCPGHTDVSARQGHYFQAVDLSTAIRDAYAWLIASYPFQTDVLDIQYWGNDPRKGQVIE